MYGPIFTISQVMVAAMKTKQSSEIGPVDCWEVENSTWVEPNMEALRGCSWYSIRSLLSQVFEEAWLFIDTDSSVWGTLPILIMNGEIWLILKQHIILIGWCLDVLSKELTPMNDPNTLPSPSGITSYRS